MYTKFNNTMTIFIVLFFFSIVANGQKIITDNIVYHSTDRGMNCTGFADESVEQDSIVFPDTIMINGEAKTIYSIHEDAFESNMKLLYVKFPNGLEHIRGGAFMNCANLEEIIIPSSVKSIAIGACAFENTNLTSIHIDSLNTIYDSRDNSNAIIVTEKNEIVLGTANTIIPSSVLKLGYQAFKGNKKLKKILIPCNVKRIEYSCFSECDSLDIVTFTDFEIGQNCFNGLEIGDGAFVDCKNIKSIALPDRLFLIGNAAFHGCEKLESMIIPANVEMVGGSIFGGCTQLSSIFVSKKNKKYDSRNNCNAIIETKTNTLISACKNTTIPNGIKKIGDAAFCNVDIDSIYIGNGVKSIGRFAFAGSKIRVIRIPNSIKVIEDGIFESCEKLNTIYLGHLSPPKFSNEDYAEQYIEEHPNLTIYVRKRAYKQFLHHPVWNKFNIKIWTTEI